MRILVLNGSPKGDLSVTMQYIKYLQKRYPQHEFPIINISQSIRQIEKDGARFEGILSEVRSADGLLWAFPLYVCLPHANYLRFLELVGERGAADAFAGKYAAVLTTSIHFFDHTAHNHMRAVCDDLGMNYTGFHSAAMDDLMKEQGRQKLEQFAEAFFHAVERRLPLPRLTPPLQSNSPAYVPGPAAPAKVDNRGCRVLIITDEGEQDTNLKRMTERLLAAFAEPVEVVRLERAAILGGCLGCLKCGFDNKCAYDGKDDVRAIYEGKIDHADIIIFAGAMRGRFLSPRFKTFVDRRFFRTHQPQMAGKQVAYLVSGPLGQTTNALEVLHAIAEMDQANLAGVVTDEHAQPAELDRLIDGLAATVVEYARAGYVRPATFLGVGGLKIFRDDIYESLRFVFQQDHKYYKKHGFYDFPQKKIGLRLQVSVMMLMSKIPSVKKYMRDEMIKLMLNGYKKVTG